MQLREPNHHEGVLLDMAGLDYLIAVCPFCEQGTVIDRIPVLSPVTENHTMYLSCLNCRAPFHVVGNFYKLVEVDGAGLLGGQAD